MFVSFNELNIQLPYLVSGIQTHPRFLGSSIKIKVKSLNFLLRVIWSSFTNISKISWNSLEPEIFSLFLFPRQVVILGSLRWDMIFVAELALGIKPSATFQKNLLNWSATIYWFVNIILSLVRYIYIYFYLFCNLNVFSYIYITKYVFCLNTLFIAFDIFSSFFPDLTSVTQVFVFNFFRSY